MKVDELGQDWGESSDALVGYLVCSVAGVKPFRLEMARTNRV